MTQKPWIPIHTFYFISNTFISNARLKFANFQNISQKILRTELWNLFQMIEKPMFLKGYIFFQICIYCILRGRSFLSTDTRLECFLRGAKFLAKNLRGLKIPQKILRGLRRIRGVKQRGAKFSSARENKGYEIFQCQREWFF